MLDFIKASVKRKIARRFFKEYPYKIDRFMVEGYGEVEFANWVNPLVRPYELTEGEMKFWTKFINKGDLVIDIGANIGDTTVPMSLVAGENGLTIGFDPNPHVYRILKINATLNKDKTNILPLPYAITSEDCEVHYSSSEASFANGGISFDNYSEHGRFSLGKKVKGINLIQFLEKKYTDWLPKLSLVKIDAEGYDVEIIKSIRDLFKKYKPTLVGEFFLKFSLEQRKLLFDVIKSLDYHLFYFYDFYDIGDIFQITENNLDRPEIFNFYALPNK